MIALDAVRGEHPHQVVLERQVEERFARIALAPGTTAELVVDPAGLVALGPQDVQAADPHHLVVLVVGLRLQLVVIGPYDSS